MNNKCSQFKEDYAKLLKLKQEFDEALENGVNNKDLDEVKEIKEKFIYWTEELSGNLFEDQANRRMREIIAFQQGDETCDTPLAESDFVIDKKDPIVLIKNSLELENFSGMLPSNMLVEGNLRLENCRLKNIGHIYADYIYLEGCEIEEITGDLHSNTAINFYKSGIKKISGNLICTEDINLEFTKSLQEITSMINCENLYLYGTNLNTLPDSTHVEGMVYIDYANKSLRDSAEKLEKRGQILEVKNYKKIKSE